MSSRTNLYCKNCNRTTTHKHITDHSDIHAKRRFYEGYFKGQGVDINDDSMWNIGGWVQWGLDKLKSIFGEGYKCVDCGSTQLYGGTFKL